jgi:hypothetical protein
MPWLPYQHDLKLAHQSQFGLRVHWFGRYAGYPSWAVPESRLAAGHGVLFFRGAKFLLGQRQRA